jgi:hypothetical protein
MRLAIGIAIGLLFGLTIGLAGMTFFNERAITELRKANKQASNTQTMASYICQWNIVDCPGRLCHKYCVRQLKLARKIRCS